MSGALSTCAIDEAVARQDWQAALFAAREQAGLLSEAGTQGLETLRELHDRYQGLIAHIDVLREDALRELRRFDGGRRAVRGYAGAMPDPHHVPRP